MPRPTASGAAAPAPGSLAQGARYGRTTRSRRRDAWMLLTVIAAIVVAVMVWATWGGGVKGLAEITGASTAASISATSGANQVLDRQNVSVSYTVTAPANASVACAVEAEDVNFTVTGWKIVRLPISSKTVRTFTTTVRTVAPSVTGDVSSCWSSARG